MAQTSIEWTATWDAVRGLWHPGMTFNPVWGCTEVSPECDNCYARGWDARWGGDHWGPGVPRRLFEDKHWAEPLAWDRKARRLGVRLKVFCASMADVFDHEWPPAVRWRLWRLIRATPYLDWLILTKRPQVFAKYLPWVRCQDDICKLGNLSNVICSDDDCDIEIDVGRPELALGMTNTTTPWPNVWLGVTAGLQKTHDTRVPHLKAVAAARKFISYEPALEEVTFDLGGIDWLICGAESGAKRRPFDEAWARSALAQCRLAGTKFFYKQKIVDGIKVGRPMLDGCTYLEQPSSAPGAAMMAA